MHVHMSPYKKTELALLYWMKEMRSHAEANTYNLWIDQRKGWSVSIYYQVIAFTKSGTCTGGSHLSRIFWEHENLSGLSIIRLIQLL